MKKIIAFLQAVFWSVTIYAAPSASDSRVLSEMRGHYKSVVEQHQNLRQQQPMIDLSHDRSAERLQEFAQLQAAFQRLIAPVVRRESHAGAAMIWVHSERLNGIPKPLPAAMGFNSGPGNAVIPFSGEFTDSASDLVLPQRGGLRFAFERNYSSFSSVDYGLGIGWDYNFNAAIRELQDEKSLLMRWQGRNITFAQTDGKWIPQAGEFFSLEIRDKQIFVLTPDLTRVEFSPAQDSSENELKRWRLAAIATRHDNWQANRLELTYLENCDRISHITDPYGQRINFAYDERGHIVQIATDRNFADFVYDQNGLLVKVVYPDKFLDLSRKTEQHAEYSYQKIGDHFMMTRKAASGFPYTLQIEYDDSSRVSQCGYFGSNMRQTWQYEYKADETIVVSPSPAPAVHYRFGGKQHPSLPQALEIPSQKAKWSYQYADNFQLAQEINPLGVTTNYQYDLTNADSKFRGNMLSREVLPSDARPSHWQKVGMEAQYHSGIAFLVSKITYQIAPDGMRTDVKKDQFEYSGEDLMLSRQDINGIVTRFICNRYGEPAMEIDANDNVTLYRYSDQLPDKNDYKFVAGNASGGGVQVAVISDSTAEQIRQSCVELEIKPFYRNEITRIAPAALESKTAWDVYGNPIRTQNGYSQSFSISSPDGTILAMYDISSGMKIYSYSPFGKNLSIEHEFCPNDKGAFQGEISPYFAGRYYQEAFTYDSLGQMTSRTSTNEPAQADGKLHPLIFERYPNGKLQSITNQDGVKRVDIYDSATGWLQARQLQGKSGNLTLTSEYKYYPDGSIRSYKDQSGGTWEYLLDGFGGKYATIAPNKVVSKQKRDAIDRIVRQTQEDDSGIISRHEYAYSAENGLLDTVKAWRIAPDINEALVVEQYKYDSAGNQIAARGVRNESWSYFLLDGMYRQVGVRNPAKDFSFAVFDQDAEVYNSSWSYDDHLKKHWKIGSYQVIDHAGRPLQTIPVDRFGKLIHERAMKNSYDAVGRLYENDSEGLSRQVFQYNTLSEVLCEQTIPKSTTLGEKPLKTTYVYSPGGNLLRKTVANTPLLLRGHVDDVTPDLVDAPQEMEYKFDEFGREIEMIQPNGLIIRKTYNEFSRPRFMEWTHIAEPDRQLRSLELNYSNLGQIVAIKNKATRKNLRAYSYDSFGNCTRMEDAAATNPVVLQRTFDSLGLKLTEAISWNKKPFPAQAFAYDLPNGELSYLWNGLAPASVENWKDVFITTDPSGRLSGLGMQRDKRQYAHWRYVGNLAVERQIPESRIIALHSYNELNEPQQTIFNTITESESRLGLLEYGYGAQGQAEFSSTRLVENSGKEYTFATHAQFDSYRRMVAQNGETRVPAVAEFKKRSRELFSTPDDFAAVLNTMRMQYDQNNNIWVNYSGALPERFAPEAIEKHQMPLFTSSALPHNSNSHSLPDLLLRELASNREAAKASFSGESDNLKADEFIYDMLGNLTSFKGDYWNGQARYPVKWELKYDALGRLVEMEAVASEDIGFVKKDSIAAKLNFVYDPENRRICKSVNDYSIFLQGTTTNTYTIFDGNNQALVFSETDKNELALTEQYLWRPDSRELLMAALSMRHAENADNNRICRYFFQQDRGLNVIFSSRLQNGQVIAVSAMSYLGFGENATHERIKGITSSMNSANVGKAYDRELDGLLSGSWGNVPGKPQFIELELENEADISQLTIWATDKFPENFLIYVLPRGENSPYAGNIDSWTLDKQKFLAAVVQDGKIQNIRRHSLSSPYRLSLGERRGNRIVIAWDDYKQSNIEVAEFEVTRIPNNPGAIAFAGQWLDRETNMYYQVNRYRLAGSDKFISPDPIGFLDGNNLYAYGHGNPLEWHDPDGRFAHILWGAGLGAAFGGGSYALNCWFTGAEFSWTQFGIQTFIGAASGTIAAATFGAGAIGGGGWLASIGNGMLSGGAAGLTVGGLDAGISGAMNGQSALDMMDSIGWAMLKGGATGMVAGGVGGGAVKLASIPRNLPRTIARLVPTTKDSLRITRGMMTAGFAGMSGGATGGAVSGAFEGFETGDYGFIGQRMWQGAAWGTGGALVAQGIMTGYERHNNITWDKNRSKYWKNEAASNPQDYSPENLARMQRGSAPQRLNPQTGMLESMELHHNVITRRTGLPRTLVDQRWNLKKVWPDEHRAIDPFRR